MTKSTLIKKLKELARENRDPEADHGKADDLLLDYINSKAVTKAFNSIDKWYA
jgi:hypothetical protein